MFQTNKNQTHTSHKPTHLRRILGLVFMMVIIFSVITARLLDLQVSQHVKLSAQANANRLYDVRVTPPRGTIRDRFGEDLTHATQVFWAPTQNDSLFAEETVVDRTSALTKMASQSGQLRIEHGRQYPWLSTLAQTIGYVGKPSHSDLQANQELLPFQLIGKAGLEFSQNEKLLGRLGSDRFELSALGLQQRKVASKQNTAGEIVATTLDPYLSLVASEAMGDNTGAVVIMDAETGELLTVVSQPSFDPNLFQSSIDESETDRHQRLTQISEWLQSPDRPLFNRAVAGAYPPGSVFKPVTAIAALENNAVTAQTEFNDEGVLKVGDFAYANWYFTQYGGREGLISLQRAIARSNDIYFYKAAEATGPIRLASMAKLFGFGQKTGIELSSEATGLVPDPDWKEQNIGEKWFLGNTYHMGIGQGDVLVTPLQVAGMTQAIAHRGVKCAPHLLSDQENSCQGLGLQSEYLDVVMAGMTDACSPGGTAFPFFEWNQERLSLAGEQGLSAWETGAVGCKTGTAEFGGQDARGFRKTHGWFTLAVKLPDLKQVDTKFTCHSELVSGSPEEMRLENMSLVNESEETTSLCTEKQQLYYDWLSLVKQQGYPRDLIITVLVESDETRPYREGSRDAAPVAKEILEWLVGNSMG